MYVAPPLLTDMGPPFAQWCTTQVGGASCRSMLHNVVLYSLGGAQRTCRSHKHTQRNRSDSIAMNINAGGKKNIDNGWLALITTIFNVKLVSMSTDKLMLMKNSLRSK